MSEPALFVTVIMPIRNEVGFIARSLGAVLVQDYPHDRMEVLIADGMSTDATRDIIASVASQHPGIRVEVIDNPRRIVPTGFNQALELAQGEIIVRIDGHTIINQDYVAQCVDLLQQGKADNVGGRMNAVGRTFLGEAVALATSSPFGVGGARFHYSEKEEYVDTVYMGAWWKKVFDCIGHFDEEMVRNQDDEFNYRMGASGKRVLLSPAIKSTYYNRSSFYGLARQYYLYGVYKIRVMQKHPAQMQIRQFVPPMFVGILLGGAILSPFSISIRGVWYLVIVVYSLANLAASIWTARKSRWSHLPLLPIVFATLHFSYGLGFLRGLIKFRNRWNDR